MSGDERKSSKPILSDQFGLSNDYEKRVHVTLFDDRISLQAIDTKAKSLSKQIDHSINDVNGCSIQKSSDKYDISSYLTIYLYEKKIDSIRQRTTIEICYDRYDTYDENLLVTKQWRKEIQNILSKKFNSADKVTDCKEKPFLVYINPFSGSGKAKYLFEEHIKPVWDEANIPYTVIMTKFANDARQQMATIDIKKYRGIVVVSGDGLAFEVINGLMDRKDCVEAIKIPIGQLPGGSGNALACCVSCISKEGLMRLNINKFAMYSAFLMCKYDVVPKDLVAIDLGVTDSTYTKHRIYSFLSVEWAIASDVDYESEKYRFMGDIRFIIGAIVRIINLRTYKGRVSFLPSDKNYKPKDSSLKIMSGKEFNKLNRTQSNLNIPVYDGVVRTKYLKPLNEPVPDDWKIIEDSFIMFFVTYLPSIGADFMVWPESKFDNGDMYLVFIKAGVSKLQLFQCLSQRETGDYLNYPYVECIRVKGFRLEPLCDNGNIMIDGEKVPYGPMQAEILPSFANCIAKN